PTAVWLSSGARTSDSSTSRPSPIVVRANDRLRRKPEAPNVAAELPFSSQYGPFAYRNGRGSRIYLSWTAQSGARSVHEYPLHRPPHSPATLREPYRATTPRRSKPRLSAQSQLREPQAGWCLQPVCDRIKAG